MRLLRKEMDAPIQSARPSRKRPIQTPTIQPKSLFGSTRDKKTLPQTKQWASFDLKMSWPALMVLAFLEELIFRGFFIRSFSALFHISIY